MIFLKKGYALLDKVTSIVFNGQPMLPLNDVWGYDDPVTGRRLYY